MINTFFYENIVLKVKHIIENLPEKSVGDVDESSIKISLVSDLANISD